MKYKLYKVGGCVRDSLLGIESKDIDFSFEFTSEFIDKFKEEPIDGFYEVMNNILKSEGFEIFLETPSCFTTRARFPKGHRHEGLTADFVMCRKETYPDKESRKPVVEMGSLYDDLERRDFCCNAIAQDENNVLIDPFNGISDIRNKILRCPINAHTSFKDDPLRAIRCLRFALTKTFTISDDCVSSLKEYDMWYKFDKVVSRERVREELSKMFKYNSLLAIEILYKYIPKTYIHKFIFKDDIWLKPTNEKQIK